jgi:hypothetical protein
MRYAVHYAVRAEAVTSSGVAKYAPRNEIASSASAADDGSALAGVLGVLAPYQAHERPIWCRDQQRVHPALAHVRSRLAG